MVCKTSTATSAGRHQELSKNQIRRLALTRHFLDANDLYASAGEITTATALLIDLIITKYPTAPRFASLLVDRLLVGDEALADALQEELGDV